MSLPFIPDLLYGGPSARSLPHLSSRASVVARHMASFAPSLSIGRLATIRRKPSGPIADRRGAMPRLRRGNPGIPIADTLICTIVQIKWTCQRKSPAADQANLSRACCRSLGTEGIAWMENFVFLLQNSDIGEGPFSAMW